MSVTTGYVPAATETDPAKLARAIRNLFENGTGITAFFIADKGATDQTGVADSTFTQVTFGNEVIDTGEYFASNAWTPPAGKVLMAAAIAFTGTLAAAAQSYIMIEKNGAFFRAESSVQNATGSSNVITVFDSANGTDVYTVFGFVDTSAGTGTVSGVTFNSWFAGLALS